MGKPQQSIFKCKHCPKEFKKQGNFENHMKHHKSPSIFTCVKCSSLFNSSAKLKYHINSEHMKLESLDCVCNKCGDTFKDEASLESHKCNEITQNDFICDKCSRSFKYLRNLKNHEKVHNRQKKEDLHSCSSCSKMFASDAALKKHEQIHDIKLKYSTGFKKSGIQNRKSINMKQKIARKSMRAVRTYWCHVCNCGCTDIDEFERHVHRHQKGNVLDRDSEKAQKKTHLSPSKPIKKYNSPTKKYKTTKQAKHLENSNQQVMNFKIESEGQQMQNIKTEAISDYGQEQPIFFDSNQISIGLAQSHHLGGMYNNFIQPVQQFSNGVINGVNMPNVQFISVSPSQNALQNDLKNIPKFNIFSEKYMNWLKTFINKCKCQKHPFSHILVKKIAKVNYDLFTALIDLKNKKDHFYLMNLYKSLESVMYDNVQYELTKTI